MTTFTSIDGTSTTTINDSFIEPTERERVLRANDAMRSALLAARALGMKIYHNANAHEAPLDWAKVKRLIDDALAQDAATPPEKPQDEREGR